MCRECQPGPVKYPLDEAALYTMQYIVTAPVEKLYTFTVTEEVLGQVTKLIQYYMRQYVEKRIEVPLFFYLRNTCNQRRKRYNLEIDVK